MNINIKPLSLPKKSEKVSQNTINKIVKNELGKFKQTTKTFMSIPKVDHFANKSEISCDEDKSLDYKKLLLKLKKLENKLDQKD